MIPVYNILENNCKIVLTHPKYVKAIQSKKIDKKDEKLIADIFEHDLVSGSFIPPAGSVSFWIWFVITQNLRTLQREKRIGYKTVLPFLTGNLRVHLEMSSTGLHQTSSVTSSQIHQKNSPMCLLSERNT